jgi:hypothetical protein
MQPSSPSEALGLTEFKGKEVSSVRDLLTTVFLEYRYVRGSERDVSMERHGCFSNGGERCLAVGSDGW